MTPITHRGFGSAHPAQPVAVWALFQLGGSYHSSGGGHSNSLWVSKSVLLQGILTPEQDLNMDFVEHCLCNGRKFFIIVIQEVSVGVLTLN